jgi:hypothetical protein
MWRCELAIWSSGLLNRRTTAINRFLRYARPGGGARRPESGNKLLSGRSFGPA